MIKPDRSDPPRETPKDERAPMAQAMGVAYEIMAIAMEMALIPLGGYWLDQKLAMGPLFLITGCVLGFSLGFYHLIRFGAVMNKKNKKRAKTHAE